MASPGSRSQSGYYTMDAQAAVAALASDAGRGLSAEQAAQRLEQYGPNRLREKKKKTNLQRFFDQFKDAMIVILLIAAAISFVIACTGHDPMEFFEPLLILLIVVLNAIMGMIQESKAEKALDALKNMSAPHARVIRGGAESVIDAAQLVPGDVIRLEAGDFIPADARLLASSSLKSEESALTGESVPSEKDAAVTVDEKAALGDRTNMVFSGCSVTYGTATALVTATGMDTEMGRIDIRIARGRRRRPDPAAEKAGAAGQISGLPGAGGLRDHLRGGPAQRHPRAGHLHDGRLAGRVRHPRGPARHRHHRSVHRRAAHGEEKRADRRLPAVETLGGASVICSTRPAPSRRTA